MTASYAATASYAVMASYAVTAACIRTRARTRISGLPETRRGFAPSLPVSRQG